MEIFNDVQFDFLLFQGEILHDRTNEVILLTTKTVFLQIMLPSELANSEQINFGPKFFWNIFHIAFYPGVICDKRNKCPPLVLT